MDYLRNKGDCKWLSPVFVLNSQSFVSVLSLQGDSHYVRGVFASERDSSRVIVASMQIAGVLGETARRMIAKLGTWVAPLEEHLPSMQDGFDPTQA